jgi:hypothetical protein
MVTWTTKNRAIIESIWAETRAPVALEGRAIADLDIKMGISEIGRRLFAKGFKNANGRPYASNDIWCLAGPFAELQIAQEEIKRLKMLLKFKETDR